MLFLQLMLAAFLALANPSHTKTNSDGATVTTNDAGTPGDPEPGGDDGPGTGTGTGGGAGQNPPPPPPKPE